ncbi:HEAT repeat domain-containing protein [Thermosynechococcus sp. FA-CM-4201]
MQKLTSSLLEQLAQDDYWQVRAAVAAHPNCPETILAQLVKDQYWQVRIAVARNAQCPLPLKQTFEHDRRVFIFHHILNRYLSLLGLSLFVKRLLAGCRYCPLWIIEELGKDQHWRVRQAIAKHPKCPPSLLESLGCVIS